jgi:hypothetical protein
MKEKQHKKKIQNKRKTTEVEDLRCRKGKWRRWGKDKKGMRDNFQNIRI